MIHKLAVVLAGGLGTRMQESLGETPKALANLHNSPFLEWKLNELSKNSIKEVLLLSGTGADAIESWLGFERGIKVGLEIRTIRDGDRQLGTGGALKQVLDLLPPSFYLTYGDNLLSMPYKDLELSLLNSNRQNSFAVVKPFREADNANCEIHGERVVRYSKSSSVGLTMMDYGVMILSRESLAKSFASKPDVFDLGEVISDLAEHDELQAHVTHHQFLEIGSPQGYLETLRTLHGK